MITRSEIENLSMAEKLLIIRYMIEKNELIYDNYYIGDYCIVGEAIIKDDKVILS
jgi:hypothetical protein